MNVLYFDGSGNRQFDKSGYGYRLELATGTVIEDTQSLPQGTSNNEAEYKGMIEGIRKAIHHGVGELLVRGDSQIIIYQMLGKYKCKAANLKPYNQEAFELVEKMPSITFEWVRRDKNKADEVSRVDTRTSPTPSMVS